MSDEDEHAMNADEVDSDQKVQTLRNVAASLYSSLSGLSNSSRTIPSEKDFHFYRNFDEFRSPIEEISRSSCSLLQSLGSSALTWGKELAFPEDIDDAYDWLVNVNDEVLERFDLSIDEFGNTRKAEGEGGKRAMEVEDGFQLVSGKKKNEEMRNQAAGSASTRQESSVKVANLKEKKVSGAKQKIPFHIPTIRKPQEEFNILVNNVNQPFQHVWLQRSEDGQRFVHPLEKVSVLDFIDTSAGKIEPVKPPPIETTPFSLIEAVKDLKEMAAKLRSVNEFAVDLEHNQYRSFQGLTCLMQISTRDEDFVVDTLKLRIHIGPYLREVFKDPTKRKVMHGADRDIVWLQRDFGIYVCNMFDTGQASRVLKLERNSLEYLLHHYCGVTANKEYQNADWRIRPLPNEMIRYAREDTHYLLHIYDVMRNELLSVSENSNDTLLEVYTRSFDICIQLYEKELLTEKSYLGIYGLLWADFNARQIAVVAGLYEWRDIVARAEDESTGFILPNKTLLEIAKQMPVTGSKLHGLLKSRHPYVERNLSSVINIIRHSVQNADAYEAVVEYLKERRKEMASLSSLLASDGSQAEPPDNPSDPIEGAVECINDSSTISQSYIDSGTQEVIPEHDAGDGRDQFSTDQSKATSINTSSSSLNSPNISAVASVEVLKKPGGAFGAFLGKPGPKRKFHTDEKDKKETKLEQIRSSVNLPFHSFLGSEAVSNMTPPAVVEESTGGLETQSSQGCAIVPISGSNAEDIIMLEDDNDAEEPAADDSETGKDLEGTDGGKPNVEDDQNYESMSLTDLSSSFQRCLESMKQNKKGGQVKKSQEMSGLSMVKPFDYESARRDIRFGEDKRGLVTEGEGEGLKSILNSGGRKNSLAIDQFKKDDESRLPQGRRRQAFPASGNRSATFR